MTPPKIARKAGRGVPAVLLTFSVFAALLQAVAILFIVDAEYNRLALSHDQEVAEMAAAQISVSIRGVERQLEWAAVLLAERREESTFIPSLLAALHAANPELLGVALLGPRDAVVAESSAAGTLDLRPSPDGRPALRRSNGIPYALLAVRVPGSGGDALAAAVNLAALPAAQRSAGDPPGGKVELVSVANDRLASDGPAGAVLQGEGRRISTSAPIPGTTWKVVVAAPRPGLLSAGHSLALLGGSALLATVFALVIALLVRRVWLRTLVERVEGLTATTASLKTAVDRKDILLRETHHRVKNDLQILSSIFNLTMRADPADFSPDLLAKSQNRVHAISLIHELLYDSTDFAGLSFRSYVEELIRRIQRSLVYDNDAVSIVARVGDYYFDAETSVACGLLLNELLTNSLKYAFPAGESGAILVQVDRIAPGQYLLSVEDDGVGLPQGWASAKPNSLGIQLVHALSDQLGGTVSVKSDPGTCWHIQFAAKEVGVAP